jgi:hypothetical protein
MDALLAVARAVRTCVLFICYSANDSNTKCVFLHYTYAANVPRHYFWDTYDGMRRGDGVIMHTDLLDGRREEVSTELMARATGVDQLSAPLSQVTQVFRCALVDPARHMTLTCPGVGETHGCMWSPPWRARRPLHPIRLQNRHQEQQVIEAHRPRRGERNRELAKGHLSFGLRVGLSVRNSDSTVQL